MAQLIEKPEQTASSQRTRPSRRPDYLLWLIIGLFLLSILIGLLTDIPAMFW